MVSDRNWYCVRCKKPQTVHDIKKYKTLRNGIMYTAKDKEGHKVFKIFAKK